MFLIDLHQVVIIAMSENINTCLSNKSNVIDLVKNKNS